MGTKTKAGSMALPLFFAEGRSILQYLFKQGIACRINRCYVIGAIAGHKSRR